MNKSILALAMGVMALASANQTECFWQYFRRPASVISKLAVLTGTSYMAYFVGGIHSMFIGFEVDLEQEKREITDLKRIKQNGFVDFDELIAKKTRHVYWVEDRIEEIEKIKQLFRKTSEDLGKRCDSIFQNTF